MGKLLIVSEVKEYLDKNYIYRINTGKISKRFDININDLRSLFYDAYSISICEYILSLRINYAIILLTKTDYSIKKIAKLIGFNEVNYFYKVFKKIVGLTPTQFRKQKKFNLKEWK